MAFAQRYVNPTGSGAHDGTSPADAWSLAEMIAAPYAAGQCINWLHGLYANTTTSRTLSVAGSTTQPIWFRGYNVTPGDCEGDQSLARPEVTFTTGGLTLSGAHSLISGINISCTARNGTLLTISGGNSRLFRMRAINQQANASSNAVTWATGANGLADACYFEATSTATVVTNSNIGGIQIERCHLKGGVSNAGGTNSINLLECLLRDAVNDAVLANVNGMSCNIQSNTIRNTGRDGIRLGASGSASPGWSKILDNLFAVIGGVGINQVLGTDVNTVTRRGNAFYSITSTREAGFGDAPAFEEIILSVDPHASATALTLVAGSNARGVQFTYENLPTTISFRDKGGPQHQDSSRRHFGGQYKAA